MATDLRELNRFREKLQKYASLNTEFASQVVEEVAKRGEQIAKEEYADHSSINVSHETISKNSARVVAQGEGIAYMEFGTGRVGENSHYPTENLPKSGVPITGNWEYYYPSEHKATKDGEEGWYAGNGAFNRGQKASMQMYRTSQRLKNEMANIVKNKLKGDGTNV